MKKIAKINKNAKLKAKTLYKITNNRRQISISQNSGSSKLILKFTKIWDIYIQDLKKGGIDKWLYCKIMLEPLLIPFIKEYNEKKIVVRKSSMIVQEYKALSYTCQY